MSPWAGTPGAGIADHRAGGDADLRLDDVDAGDLLRHRVLDLDARIDLDEVEGAGVGVHQELDRAGAAIVCGAADPEAVIAKFGALIRRQVGGGCALHHLLVATLDGAVALEQVHKVAMRVAEDLHLDMTGALDQLLEIDLVLAEGRLCLALRRVDVAHQRLLVADDAHAASAAAPGGLQHHRVADPRRQPAHLGHVVGQRIGRRHHRNAGLDGEIARRHLVAETPHRLRRRADEDDAGLGAGLGEFGAFREKAVTGMDGVGAGRLRHPHDLGDRKIGLDRTERLGQMRPASDLIRLVGLEPVQRQLVLLCIDRDRAHAEFVRRTENADGDLGTVGDENLANGQVHPSSHCRRNLSAAAFASPPSSGSEGPWEGDSGRPRREAGAMTPEGVPERDRMVNPFRERPGRPARRPSRQGHACGCRHNIWREQNGNMIVSAIRACFVPGFTESLTGCFQFSVPG